LLGGAASEGEDALEAKVEQGKGLLLAADKRDEGVALLEEAAANVPRDRAVTLEVLKEVGEIFKSFVTGFALVIGGFWTYVLFIRHREKYPRARIEHIITHRALSDSQILVRLEMRISNVGKVLLPLDRGFVRLQQVLPCPQDVLSWLSGSHNAEEDHDKREADWPMIANRSLWNMASEFEPGESESLHFDFIIDATVETILVYSHVDNAAKRKGGREIGWNTKSIYDLPPGCPPVGAPNL